MRKTFSKEIEQLAKEDDKLVFITGDLGFNAFENLQSILGDRFINAGVAEQHMVGMAAGLASKGHRVFVYSIAPFIVYRALEQIRNDLCFHNLPVCLVGNGGGYGYGIMGSSHHALSDVGYLSTLPNMKAFVPAFDNDIPIHLDAVQKHKGPSYLRLGYGPSQHRYNDFNDIQFMHKATHLKVTVCYMGPIVNNLLEHPEWNEVSQFTDVFSVQAYPIGSLSKQLQDSLRESKKLITAEEHYSNAGLGQQLSVLILQNSMHLDSYTSKFAVGYPNQQYGSQSYHQEQSGLDGDSIIENIKSMISHD